jgi:hypothetical protein
MQDGNPEFGNKLKNPALSPPLSEDRLAGSLFMGTGRFYKQNPDSADTEGGTDSLSTIAGVNNEQ